MVFGQTLRHGFVNFDDDEYVYKNPMVSRGLTLPGMVWAFNGAHAANWHPVTWLSHMLDCQIYGLAPGGHHLTNVLLHTMAAILLFLVLRRMTGCLWRSALVAAVFAVHPLRVESVAWVAERKDVLSGVFFMLTLGAYVSYARHPWSPARYALVTSLFAVGLMCKPMLVTLPVVLLLLDYWPLNRWGGDGAQAPVFRLGGWRMPRRLVLEKLPWLGLTVATVVATLLAQTHAIRPLEVISPSWRVTNSLIAAATYVGKMFWPSGLAILYPYRVNGGSPGDLLLAVVILLSITGFALGLRKSRPYLLVGWLWYLVMLTPVIGIIQVGMQARADRYTYLPQIGLYVLLTWAMADLAAGWRCRRVALGGGSAILLAALIYGAHAQTAVWRTSESLWTHTLACTPRNLIAHYNLGCALLDEGRLDEAIIQYRTALKLKPDYAVAHNGLGSALFQKGRLDEALAEYQTTLQLDPDIAIAQNNYGNALLQKGNLAEAIRHFQAAIDLKPDYVEALNTLVWVLAANSQAALRDGPRAVELARRACELTQDGNPLILGGLAAAYAEAGRFPEALETAQRAAELADAQANPTLAGNLRAEWQLYQDGHPFRIH